MNPQQVRGFHFGNDRQWQACRFVQVDSAAARDGRVRPLAPLARPGALQESIGAYAPVVTESGEVLWRDDLGCIHRDRDCNDAPVIQEAPRPIARATRLVATRDSVWVIDGPATVS